jgi:ferredoxin
MIIITLQRDKCIGCNYCEEVSPEHFGMSEEDGKAILKKSVEKKGFHTLKHHDYAEWEADKEAENNCPAKIIQVKRV